jgi:hypothetical protein
MTQEIIEFKCPTCGHLLGEEEHTHAWNEMNRIIIERTKEQDAIKDKEHRKEIEELKEQQCKKIQEMEQFKESEIQSRIHQALSEERATTELKHRKELQRREQNKESEMNSKYHGALAEKDRQIEAAKLEGAQKITQYELQLSRMHGQLEKMQKTVDSIPPELRGTAGEFVLLEELNNGFPKDDIQAKKPGREMADVIHTIVTDTGQRISPPIVYDMKTGESVTPTDIFKAKRYKEIHNTDYSIIVTAKGIRPKDCKANRMSLIGEREGILLFHPLVVVEEARLIRNFIIENAEQRTINNGGKSKHKKLYDYLTSPERDRKIHEKMRIKSKLDDQQTKEEEYHKRLWKNRKDMVQELFDTEEEDKRMIKEIIQGDADIGVVSQLELKETSINNQKNCKNEWDMGFSGRLQRLPTTSENNMSDISDMVFGCYYCNEYFSSDMERRNHRQLQHTSKLDYPSAEEFKNRQRPNRSLSDGGSSWNLGDNVL